MIRVDDQQNQMSCPSYYYHRVTQSYSLCFWQRTIHHNHEYFIFALIVVGMLVCEA